MSAVLAGTLLLAGCGTVTAPRPGSPEAAARERSDALTVERDWLQSWFKGTPVRIWQRGDSELNVAVPREFSFDPGRDRIKPPLAAVLDKVAESLRRVMAAELVSVAAPGDTPAASRLALRRAQRVQQYLRSRGVPADRRGQAAASATDAVQLRIVLVEP